MFACPFVILRNNSFELEESLSQETITAEDGIYSQYHNELAFEAALLLPEL